MDEVAAVRSRVSYLEPASDWLMLTRGSTRYVAVAEPESMAKSGGFLFRLAHQRQSVVCLVFLATGSSKVLRARTVIKCCRSEVTLTDIDCGSVQAPKALEDLQRMSTIRLIPQGALDCRGKRTGL